MAARPMTTYKKVTRVENGVTTNIVVPVYSHASPLNQADENQADDDVIITGDPEASGPVDSSENLELPNESASCSIDPGVEPVEITPDADKPVLDTIDLTSSPEKGTAPCEISRPEQSSIANALATDAAQLVSGRPTGIVNPITCSSSASASTTHTASAAALSETPSDCVTPVTVYQNVATTGCQVDSIAYELQSSYCQSQLQSAAPVVIAPPSGTEISSISVMSSPRSMSKQEAVAAGWFATEDKADNLQSSTEMPSIQAPCDASVLSGMLPPTTSFAAGPLVENSFMSPMEFVRSVICTSANLALGVGVEIAPVMPAAPEIPCTYAVGGNAVTYQQELYTDMPVDKNPRARNETIDLEEHLDGETGDEDGYASGRLVSEDDEPLSALTEGTDNDGGQAKAKPEKKTSRGKAKPVKNSRKTSAVKRKKPGKTFFSVRRKKFNTTLAVKQEPAEKSLTVKHEELDEALPIKQETSEKTLVLRNAKAKKALTVKPGRPKKTLPIKRAKPVKTLVVKRQTSKKTVLVKRGSRRTPTLPRSSRKTVLKTNVSRGYGRIPELKLSRSGRKTMQKTNTAKRTAGRPLTSSERHHLKPCSVSLQQLTLPAATVSARNMWRYACCRQLVPPTTGSCGLCHGRQRSYSHNKVEVVQKFRTSSQRHTGVVKTRSEFSVDPVTTESRKSNPPMQRAMKTRSELSVDPSTSLSKKPQPPVKQLPVKRAAEKRSEFSVDPATSESKKPKPAVQQSPTEMEQESDNASGPSSQEKKYLVIRSDTGTFVLPVESAVGCIVSQQEVGNMLCSQAMSSSSLQAGEFSRDTLLAACSQLEQSSSRTASAGDKPFPTGPYFTSTSATQKTHFGRRKSAVQKQTLPPLPSVTDTAAVNRIATRKRYLDGSVDRARRSVTGKTMSRELRALDV